MGAVAVYMCERVNFPTPTWHSHDMSTVVREILSAGWGEGWNDTSVHNVCVLP